MAARIVQAKKKIAAARIPFPVPSDPELAARIEAVLEVVHLVFSTGHIAPAGDDLMRRDLMRRDLIQRAVDLATMPRALLAGEPGPAGRPARPARSPLSS